MRFQDLRFLIVAVYLRVHMDLMPPVPGVWLLSGSSAQLSYSL